MKLNSPISSILYFGKLSALIVLFCAQLSHAQHYKIELQLPMAAGRKAFMAYHYLDNVYLRDSCLLDDKGLGVWEGDSVAPQGLYKVFFNSGQHFDFLLGADQEFTLSNTAYLSHTMQISGAPETKAFANYLAFIETLKKRGAELNEKQKNTASPKEKAEIQQQRNALNQEMYAWWDKVGDELPNSFVHKFLWANYVPKLDENTLSAEVLQNDSLLFWARFNYQLQHYWDYFDYTDERFLYTPFYKRKLETWFTKVLYPAYDSVKPYVYRFIEEVEPSKRIFQFTTSYFLNASINSKIMGMDALFVDLAEDFYLSGKAFWVSEKSLEKVKENVIFMKNNLIGNTAPDLILESFDGEFIRLHQIESKVCVVLIYEPNCSHCKVFVPEFYTDVFLPNKDKGLSVFAVYSMDNKQEWTDFLVKNDMFEWINVWDEEHSSGFKLLYDARNTPGVFVLDENKTIIAKKLNIEGLKLIIEQKLN